jgi:hypothetical protein
MWIIKAQLTGQKLNNGNSPPVYYHAIEQYLDAAVFDKHELLAPISESLGLLTF